MDIVMPYFKKNKKWYYHSEDGIKTKHGDTIYVKLTAEGEKIKKVKDSYNQYIKDLQDA